MKNVYEEIYFEIIKSKFHQGLSFEIQSPILFNEKVSNQADESISKKSHRIFVEIPNLKRKWVFRTDNTAILHTDPLTKNLAHQDDAQNRKIKCSNEQRTCN